MLSDETIVSVRDAGKYYKIFNKPVDRLSNAIFQCKNYNEFWALKPLSVDIRRGESWGIIGKNGSGKSTFLQLLTGTLTPSTGSILVRGTVSALLELGAGFNPEYTGIENIYLYSTLLGLSTTSIDNSLDSILSFADIGDHVHQPVKTYSSGMFLRLAFACAINVDPNILIVDEALAVGDAKFQLKCYKRIRSMIDSGTSLLFVSHSTEAVKELCSKSLLLDSGDLRYSGDTLDAVVKYYQILFPKESGHVQEKEIPLEFIDNSDGLPLVRNSTTNNIEFYPADSVSNFFGVGGAEIKSLTLLGISNPGVIAPNDKLQLITKVALDSEFIRQYLLVNPLTPNITTGIAFTDVKGLPVFGLNGFDASHQIDPSLDFVTTTISFECPHIRPGDYFITVAVALGTMNNHVQLQCYDAFCKINVISGSIPVNGMIGLGYEYDSFPHASQ